MARGPTLKAPPWECDSVLVWQPLTAAESQSGPPKAPEGQMFPWQTHGIPSSSLDLI